MTFTGKILVVLNLLMSFMFMAFAVMVYTSRTDMRGQLKGADQKFAAANKAADEAKTEKDAAASKLADEQNKFKQGLDKAEQERVRLDSQVKRLNSDLTAERAKIADSTAVASLAVKEANERRAEVDALRKFRSDLLKQNTDLVNEKTKLSDELAQSKNSLQLAAQRNEQMLDRVKKLEGYAIRIKGAVPEDEVLESVKDVVAPPEVEGIVTKVDRENKFIQLSLGADDGIRKGQALEVWRTGANAKYLGRVKIFTVDATSSVAKPVSVSGMIQENDRVGPRIMTAGKAN